MIYIALLVVIAVIACGVVAFFYRKNADLRDKNNLLQSVINLNEQKITTLNNELDSQDAEIRTLIEQKANLQTAIEYEKKIHTQKFDEIQQLREQSKNEFKILAQNVLEEKLKLHKESQEENLNVILKPLQNQIDLFKKRVDEIYDKESKERISLGSEITHLKELNYKISQDAMNLANALKGNNKTQGNWGEMILENLLQDSGLIKNRDYIVQQTTKDEDGNNLRPDVIINLPNNKKIIIDSKVSLIDYEQYANVANSDEGDFLNKYIISLRNHIKELSKKNYASAFESGESLDFVIMFVPVEGAFLDALRLDNELFSFAYSKNIILVSPTTLLATLRTIGNIWRNERQNSNVREILETASSLYDKFELFYRSFESIGGNITRIEKDYKSALNQLKDGKGSIYSKFQKLDDLGVKVKNRLPNEN